MKLIDRLKSAFTPFVGKPVGKRALHDIRAAYAAALHAHVMQEGVFTINDTNALVVEIPDVIVAEFVAKQFDLNV